MGWLRNWRRRRLLAHRRIDDALWRSVTLSMPFLRGLSREEMQRLRRVIQVVQSERGGSPLSADTKICQALASITDGLDVVLIMAAAVEMIEPREEEGFRA